MSLTNGTRLGPYELLAPLGAGGMGEVWKARDTRLKRTVALKVAKAGFGERFQTEARAVAALNHPNICQIYDVGPDYFVMELVEGVPLKGPLPVEKATEYAGQILDALDAAHRKGITHRDLKPANILVTSQGIKLLDFGIAKQAPELKESDETLTDTLTAPGEVPGTAPYIAPERLQGKEADARSDLFSFGCVLYEMLGGTKAFEGPTTPTVLAAILEHEPAPLAVAPALEWVIRKCLAKDPDERFQSARDLKYSLALAPERQPPATATSERPKRRPRRWAIALAAIVALVVITGLWPVSPPTTRVTMLTNDERGKGGSLLVSGGRVFYAASGLGMLSHRYGLWSVPAGGGEPRREPVPCDSETESSAIEGISYLRQRLLLVCSGEKPGADLWLVDFDGGNPKWIGHHNLENLDVSISPDLSTLLFRRKEGLFLKPVDGGAERLLTRVDLLDYSPFWHPAGGRIGFLRLVGSDPKAWEIRADGTGMRPLLPDFSGGQNFAQWSPDGRRLYFTEGGNIYVQGSRGWLGWMRRPAPARLTSDPTKFTAPYEDPANPLAVYAKGNSYQASALKLNRKTDVWEPFLGGISADCVNYSPDGQWVAYASWPYGDLCKCRPDGSGKVLLQAGFLSVHPRWSPDGTRLAFAARKYGQSFRIYTISARGGNPEPVPGVPGPAFDPSWSPDGKRLAFAPLAGEVSKEQQHVSIVELETGAVQTVPGSEGYCFANWSPDGSWLAAVTCDKQWPFLYSFATQKWSELWPNRLGLNHWSKDSRYLYGLAEPGRTIVRIEVATRKEEEIHRITGFSLTGVLGVGAYWTPDEEPVVLKSMTSIQIYRIDRDR